MDLVSNRKVPMIVKEVKKSISNSKLAFNTRINHVCRFNINSIMNRKIAILACLSSFHSSYSVAGVVLDQLRLLSKYEDIVFITADDFKDQHLVPEGVEIRYYSRYSHSVKPDDIDLYEFERYTFECSSILRNHLSDCTHVIQHDLLFIHDFLAINESIRKCGMLLPDLKWLHWQHSAPSKRPTTCEYPYTGCYSGMDNSKFIYLNRTDIPAVAKMYAIPENQISIVNNFIDFKTLFKLHPLTCELIDAYNLFDADTICIYPSRLVFAKQPDKIIKLFSKLKQIQKVRLIICNSWSNGEDEIAYMNKLKEESNLETSELIFTSEFKSKWCEENNHDITLGVPKDVVSDLMRISDLFILPSISECCSLIMLEAGANKNLMILNDDLWSLHEFGGQKKFGNKSEKAMYFEFGSLSRPIESYLPSEDAWYTDRARDIINYQTSNQAINFFRQIRLRHSPDWVYFNQILPLL